MPRPASPLDGQTVREVPVAELNRHTSSIVRSVEDGERLIVTRHAEPLAVVFSVRDAIELAIEGQRAALALTAGRDLEDGRVEALGQPGPWRRVVMARAAASSCQRMNARDRRLLRNALLRGDADDGRLLWLPSGRWLVAFSYVDDDTVLVHEAFEAQELRRALVGDEIFGRRRRIELERGMHDRD